MDLDQLTDAMATALAAHVPGARRDGDAPCVRLPFADLRAEVRVQRVWDTGIVQQHVWLGGGPLGERWIEDNFAGFAESPAEAVVHGVHNWVHGNFGAVRAAFDGGEPTMTLTIDGQDFDVFTSAIGGRGARVAPLVDSLDAPIVARIADALPVLHPTGPTFVGAFLAHSGADSITNEIKVDGSDWPADPAVTWPPGDDYSSARQLAVLVPRAPRTDWPPAEALRRTLAMLPNSESGPGVFGAAAHGYALQPPLATAPADVPDDYAWFVTHVGAAGAGPGYGLLAPDHPAQAPLRDGSFDGSAPRGVVALAHHGCNAMALLVCTGSHAGEVWVGGHDELTRLADSFRDYYESWLLSAVRRLRALRVIDPNQCALPAALSSFLHSYEEKHPGVDPREALAGLGDGAIATASSGDDYFDNGDGLDLCAGCVELAHNLGLQPRHIVGGVPPKQGR